jgi:thiamine phosphate synthase YjbQ (UPF0047 family)
MNHQQQITITTTGSGDMHDLTDKVAAVVASSESKPGLSTFFMSAALRRLEPSSSSRDYSMTCRPF